MVTTKTIEKEYKGYTIRIRELVEEIENIESKHSPTSRTILTFPREHLSIRKPDGTFFNNEDIVKIIRKGIRALTDDKYERRRTNKRILETL